MEWSTEVRRLTIGSAPDLATQEEFELALAARTVQSVCGGLTLSTIGLTASDSAFRRLAAARTLLRQLGFV